MKVFLKALVIASASAALIAGPVSEAFAKPGKGGGGGGVSSSSSGSHHHHHRGRNIGIGLGVAAAAIAIGAAAASANDGGRQCRRWDRMCDDGASWACRKYRKYCD